MAEVANIQDLRAALAARKDAAALRWSPSLTDVVSGAIDAMQDILAYAASLEKQIDVLARHVQRHEDTLTAVRGSHR